MTLKGKTFLGIALGEETFLISELSLKGRTYYMRQTAEWRLPEGVSEAESIGNSFQVFLSSRRISTSSPVFIGVPAKWILAKEKKVPRLDNETLSNLLRLEAEKDFSLSADELVLDYVKNEGKDTAGDSVLLLAISRNRMEFISRVAKNAGLKMAAVVPFSLAIGSNYAVGQDFVLLYLGRETAEFTLYSGGAPVILKHLGVFTQHKTGEEKLSLNRLVSISEEIKRILMFLPDDENCSLPSEITVWDDYGLTKQEEETLEKVLPLHCKITRQPSGDTNSSNRITFGAPTALARYGGNRSGLPVNFLHSHLVVHKKFRWQKMIVRAAMIFTLIAFAVVAGMLDLHKKEQKVAEIKEQLARLSPELERAKEMLDYIACLRTWQGQKMTFLECLREVTLAFPSGGGIWVTSIAIRDDMRGLVSGKSVDSKTVLELVDKIKQNKSFSDVNLLYIRQSSGSSQDIVYAVSFIFRGIDEMNTDTRRDVQ